MKTTLAIPNYNGSENLSALISRVLEEDFDEVYVLDDCSTDNSLEMLEPFKNRIRVVQGRENVGAGANRNRVIDFVKEGIIMFLDADMELQTRGVVDIAKALFEDKNVALVGGLILNKHGKPMSWNFGPEMHPTNDARANAFMELAERYSDNPEILDFIYQQAMPYSPSWSVFNHEPIERVVDWAAEGSFCVKADIFAEIGGYDEKMRHHETHDLSKRIRDTGAIIKFTPRIVARHLEIDARGETRQKGFTDAQLYFYQKHWGMSEDMFNRLFGITE